MIALCAISCTSKKPTNALESDYIIQKDSFISILADVQIIEAGLRKEAVSSEKLKQLSNQYYQFLFEQYNIDKQRFDSSLNYYKMNLDEFESLYKEVIKTLEKKKELVLTE